jgi:hypothetical protein
VNNSRYSCSCAVGRAEETKRDENLAAFIANGGVSFRRASSARRERTSLLALDLSVAGLNFVLLPTVVVQLLSKEERETRRPTQVIYIDSEHVMTQPNPSMIEPSIILHSQHVVRWRLERGHCARCGWSTPIGKHLATHCTREPNSRLPQPPQNAVAGHRVAAIELGKRERPIELDEFDDGWKRPRAEDTIAWEPELPPLYANEAASDSEEKFED